MGIEKVGLKINEKLPKVLFYKRPTRSIMHPPQTEYIAFSTNGDKNWGELIIHKSSLQHREDYSGNTLAIDFIASKEKRKGLGGAMIKFAKNLSKQKGCNGFLVLKADSTIDSHRVPHIFYRKQGFTTLDKKIDNKLDMFIKNNQQATSNDFSTQLMYYPAPPKKQGFWDKIKGFLKI